MFPFSMFLELTASIIKDRCLPSLSSLGISFHPPAFVAPFSAGLQGPPASLLTPIKVPLLSTASPPVPSDGNRCVGLRLLRVHVLLCRSGVGGACKASLQRHDLFG